MLFSYRIEQHDFVCSDENFMRQFLHNDAAIPLLRRVQFRSNNVANINSRRPIVIMSRRKICPLHFILQHKKNFFSIFVPHVNLK